MESMKTNSTPSFLKTHKGRVTIAVAVGLLVTSIGLVWLVARAAGLFGAVESDSGILTANAKVLSDASASGGKVIQFTASTPTPPPSPPPPTTGYVSKFGMSAPANEWDQRLAEVGGKTNIKFRRVFYQGFGQSFNLVQKAISDGMVPIISFKVSPYTWREVASGAADADIRAMVQRLNAIPGEKFVALHHEPAKDGTAKDWSDMQIRALPIIKAAGQNIKVGVIGNGWWFSDQANGYTDAEIAEYIPRGVINVSDYIAADLYQDSNEASNDKAISVKVQRMAAWARRTGGITQLGAGEFNAQTAAALTNGMNAFKAEPLFKFAAIWNDTLAIATILEGERLEAFKRAIATPNQTQ